MEIMIWKINKFKWMERVECNIIWFVCDTKSICFKKSEFLNICDASE